MHDDQPTSKSTTLPRAGRVARLAEQLATWPRRTVRLAEIWKMWDDADPAGVGALDRRALLAAALEELEDAGLLRRSSATDRSALPPLPTQVSLPSTDALPSANDLLTAVIWRPEMAWVTSATRLTIGQVQFLAKVNSWLRDRGRGTDVVPLRERSLEIIGHEKALDRAISTGLFAPNRLSLGLLRAFRSHPPLPAVRVGDGPVLLVVENEDTFSTLLECARRDPQEVGVVGWGAGGAFEASVRSVADLNPPVLEVRYFGDLDYDGLRIPTNSARTATTENLPSVLPATGLYRQLLADGVPQPGQSIQDASVVAAVVEWLAMGEDHQERSIVEEVAELLRGGARIPQEAVGVRQLHLGWPGPR